MTNGVREVEVSQDKEIMEIQKQAGNIVRRAQGFQLVSEDSYLKATEVSSWLSRSINKIDERRKFFTQPLNDQIKKINVLFKQIASPYIEAESIMTNKIMAARAEKQRKAQEEEARIRLEAEKLSKKTGIKKEEIIESYEIPAVQKSEGQATFREVTDFEIENESKVPREYMEVSEPKIRKAVREGVTNIPGVKIFKKEVLVNR